MWTIAYLETGKQVIPQAQPEDSVQDAGLDVPANSQQPKDEPSTKNGYKRAPELAGISGYINANENLKIGDFRGKVVLIDFWTYTCINCIRTLPHLVEWDSMYKDKGLVIIGVHTPEFDFEKERKNVEDSMKRHGIKYRVVQDNDYRTWNAFGNRYWPRKYLIDKEGFIRYDKIGEGGYEQTENKIREILAEIDAPLDSSLSKVPDTTPTIRSTPELYAGYDFSIPRGQNIGNEGGLKAGKNHTYSLPSQIKPDIIYLEGNWFSGPDELRANSNGAIVLPFLASSVNIVADSEASSKMYVKIDGSYSAGQMGKDIVIEDGRAYVLIDSPRLYNVFNGEYGRKTLRLEVSDGFSFNAFTFG